MRFAARTRIVGPIIVGDRGDACVRARARARLSKAPLAADPEAVPRLMIAAYCNIDRRDDIETTD